MHQGVFHALDQAECALGVAGLPPDNIIRAELRDAKASIRRLMEAVDRAELMLRKSSVAFDAVAATCIVNEIRKAIAECRHNASFSDPSAASED